MRILSCKLAAATLAAIAITLLIHDGRPLSQWPDFLAINFLIAMLPAMFKASLIIPIAQGNDGAPRIERDKDTHR